LNPMTFLPCVSSSAITFLYARPLSPSTFPPSLPPSLLSFFPSSLSFLSFSSTGGGIQTLAQALPLDPGCHPFCVGYF
jgi:hypothetical protein